MGEPGSFSIEHIAVAQQMDALVIAPATANTLAKLAHGIADDLLTTIALATTAPIVVAPAMNVNMWHHPATQKNLATLRARGVHIVEPGSGSLACGMVGEGRLAEPLEIADAVMAITQPFLDLKGETMLITAGGTREAIDPVRFVGNRSSGRMGFALAEAAMIRGARVILVTATQAPACLNCEVHSVTTAAEMQAGMLQALPQATTVIMAAAVSDYHVLSPSPQKLKKAAALTLELVPNDDILKQVSAARRPGTIVIGFAAETENLREEARRKLLAKGLDAIVANDVSGADSGFEVDRNAGLFVTRDSEIALPPSSKLEMAGRILDQLTALRLSRAALVY